MELYLINKIPHNSTRALPIKAYRTLAKPSLNFWDCISSFHYGDWFKSRGTKLKRKH